MSEALITRPTLAAYKEALLAASAAGHFPALTIVKDDFGRNSYACQYLTECGKKCAIGIILPDEICREANTIQNAGVSEDSVWQIVSGYLPETISRRMAQDIQYAHDNLGHSLRTGGSRFGQEWPHEEFAAQIEKIMGAESAPL